MLQETRFASFEKGFAQIVSIVFHPLFIPTYTFLLFMQNNSLSFFLITPGSQWMLLGLIVFTTFLLPAMMMLFMYKMKLISSLTIRQRSDRPGPILVTAIFFYLTYYLLKRLEIAPVFYVYMLGATTLAIISLLITLYWKISLHLVAAGGVTAVVTGFSFISQQAEPMLIISCLILSGLVGYARLRLNAHHPMEIYAGYGLGFVIMSSLYLIVS